SASWGVASGRMKKAHQKTDPALDPPYLATIYPIRRRGLPSPSGREVQGPALPSPSCAGPEQAVERFTLGGLVGFWARFNPAPCPIRAEVGRLLSSMWPWARETAQDWASGATWCAAH